MKLILAFQSVLFESEQTGAWVVPSEKQLRQEFYVEHQLKRNNFFDSEEDFLEAAANGTPEIITPETDRQISYRSRTRNYGDLIDLLSSYRSWPEFRNEDTVKNLYDRMEARQPLDMPVIIEFSNGRRRIFSGNTRMDIAFQLGINPHVLVVKSDRPC